MENIETKAKPPKRAIWSGSISIGLVNVPVKLYPMIYDKSFSFRMLHKSDGYPLRYTKVCSREGEEVEKNDIIKGYEVKRGEFVMITDDELKTLAPETDKRIRLDKFVPFLSIDPIYLEKSYILTPNKSPEAYNLLLMTLRNLGMAGVGKFTLRSKEAPILLHEYKGALLLTTLRYSYEVVDPQDMEEINNLKEPSEKELELAIRIIENLSGELDITEYRDTYSERVKELIEMKSKGEVIFIEEPKKEEVKDLMAALQMTLKELEEK